MVAKQIVMSNYSTNLTEKQWQVIKNIVEPQERTRKKCLREILNAIFYISKKWLSMANVAFRLRPLANCLPTDFLAIL